MHITNFLYSSYWFSQPNPAVRGVESFYLVFLLGLVLAGIVLLLVRRSAVENVLRLVLQRYSTLALSMGLAGLVLFLFRQQRVFFLGWRFWFLIWFVVFVIWLWKLLVYTLKRLPTIKAENKERQMREKYLPKSKR